MKIAVIGNYGATNVGDEAILRSILNTLNGHSVTVFSAHPQETKQQFKTASAALFPLGIRSFLKFRFRSSLKALDQVDAVLLGGGGLFQDDKLYACFLWAWQIFWVRWCKKPLFIYATGVGPLKTRWGQRLTRWAYQQAQGITVRDFSSQQALLQLGLPPSSIHLSADPTFLLPVVSTHKVLTSGKKLLLSLRPWLTYTPQILQSVTDFLLSLKKEGWQFTFVVMQSIQEEDHSLLSHISEKTGGELFIPSDFNALLEKMNQVDVAIGMRYHFLIASLLTQTPFLPLSYSPKVSELVQGTALELLLIPIENISSEVLEKNFQSLIQKKKSFHESQKTQLSTLRQLARKNEEVLLEFIKTIDLG